MPTVGAGGSAWPGSGPSGSSGSASSGRRCDPEVSWLRGELDLGIATPLADPIPGLAEPVAVQGSAGDESCEFAFVPAAYTAVRAWLESSPPGYNVNVA